MANMVEIKNQCVKWIRDFFEVNGKGCNAVVAISGGKDSSVVAALCVEALGAERVIGVLLPNGVQPDIDDSMKLVNHLGIKKYIINISSSVTGLHNELSKELQNISEQTKINLQPRIRMAATYAVSQSNNGRVANTCNLSEDWIGYSTRYGDSAGDFAPIAHLTVDEVKQIGHILNLPYDLVEKTPSDGLCGYTDEDKIGFSYSVLDKYIRTGECEDLEIKKRIDRLHVINKFKLELMPSFNPKELPIGIKEN